MQPALLVLYERYENSLYSIANDLADRGYGDWVQPVIGDVTDAARLNLCSQSTFRKSSFTPRPISMCRSWSSTPGRR